MAQSKPLFIPWLLAKIDSGDYPGVAWANPEKTQFSVPWKHALRQDSSSVDVMIFKAWAVVSGNGRANGDPSVWKRNFRSTLRAKGFTMVTDNRNDTANPLKVFCWPEERISATPPVECQDEEALFYPVQEATPEVTWSHIEPGFINSAHLPEDAVFIGTESTINPDHLGECLLGLNLRTTDNMAVLEIPPGQQPIQVIAGAGLPEQHLYPEVLGAEGGVRLDQAVYPMAEDECGAIDQQVVAQFLETLSKTKVGDHFRTQFRVSVFYRGLKVSENVVENEAGFKLVFRPEMTGLLDDPQTGLTMVPLPRPQVAHQLQASLTQRVLDTLGDGLEVRVSGPVVYGQRRGDSRAFWSTCKFDHSRTPQEVSKMEPQPLFLFRDFVKGILDFIGGKDSPSCALYFCLGERWPDPDNRPWEKKLIMVEVVFTSLEILQNMAVGGGASSLKSVELQFSLEEMMMS